VTVNVGAALTLTGTNQAYGLSSRRGIDMAAKEINAGAVPGVRINVKTVDDLGTPQGAAAAYGIFFRDGVCAIMGPTLSSVALTVDHFAQGARIPVLGISNTQPGITEIGTFIFRPALTENVLLPDLVKTVATSSLAPKTAVLIQGSDEFAVTSAPIFAGAFEANQIALTKTIVVPPATTDFTAIAAEVKAVDPDVVAITALPAEGVPLLKALRAAGVRKKVLGSNAFNTQEIIKGAGAAANATTQTQFWALSSLTFLARPFGGVLFAAIADLKGRKPALMLSVACMGVASLLLGCLPTHQHIGVAAPVLLALLRFAQGLALGGEFAAALVAAFELAPAGGKNLGGAFAYVASAAGIILGIVIPVIILTAMQDNARGGRGARGGARGRAARAGFRDAQ